MQHDEMLGQMQAMNSQMLELELRVREVEAENARLQTDIEARHHEKVQAVLSVRSRAWQRGSPP